MTSRFQAPDGRELAYQDTHTDGPAVLCLPGLTRNSRDFAGLAQHLAPHYRVLRLDPRGRGLSEWAADPLSEYTVAVEAGDALALMDHLGLERAAIIGTSRGGLMGMTVAAAQPARVRGLVLNDIGPVIEPEGLSFIMTYLGVEPDFANFEEAAKALSQTFASVYPDLTPEQWMGLARTLYRDEGGQPRLSYDPRLREAVAAGMEQEPGDPWPLFDALEGVPVLAIRGERSNILSAETFEEMARRRPDMTRVTVPNRGHPPFLDEPGAREAINAFLEGLES